MSSDNKKQHHILVTGGSGFLGSNIVEGLLNKHPNWHVSILDINPPPPRLTSRISAYLPADITAPESLTKAFSTYNPDLIIHTAGIVPARTERYSTSPTVWERVKNINYTGTQNIVQAALSHTTCKRLVYTSSCTVIIDDLDHDYHNIAEEDYALGKAYLHYGKSKALAESFVMSTDLAEQGFLVCALRPSTIIGPGDTAVIGLMHDLIAKGETGFIVGDGDNFYDFVYIDNAAQAHILAAENLLSSGSSGSSSSERPSAAGEVFNISNLEPVYFWDFLAAVWAHFGHFPRFRIRIPAGVAWFVGLVLEWVTWVMGTASTLDRGSVKDGVRTYYANCNKAVRLLGYRPTVSLAEGLRRSCEDYKGVLARREIEKRESKKVR